MICSQCGEDNKPEAKFCNGCGAEIVVDEVAVEEVEVGDVALSSVKPYDQKWLGIAKICAIIGGCAIGLGALFMMLGFAKSPGMLAECSILFGVCLLIANITIHAKVKSWRANGGEKKPSVAARNIGIVILVIAGVFIFTYKSPEEKFAITAVRVIQADLKDPSSIDLHSISVSTLESGGYRAKVDYSANNSLGGKARHEEYYPKYKKDEKAIDTIKLDHKKIQKAVLKE